MYNNGVKRNYYTDFTGTGLDFESDLYNLSIPGYSVQFFFDKDLKTVLIEKKDIKIQVIGSNFKVTTPDGFVYNFNNQQTGTTASLEHYISSWLLTSITNPRGTDSINFTYTGAKTIYQFSYAKTKTYNLLSYGSCPTRYDANPITISTCDEKYIQSISFDNNHIYFDLDKSVSNPREDLANAERLGKIRIVNSRNDTIRSFSFIYSYFEQNNANAGYSSLISQPLSHKRLKLDQLIETGKPPYQFGYMTNTVPPKTTFDQDFWGYYNGAGNGDLIPECNSDNTEFPGANRNPNSLYVQTALLNEITYPTGGKTNFTYEINKASDNTTHAVPHSFDYAEGHNYLHGDEIVIEKLTFMPVNLLH
jgi:hypothetical protein